MKQPNILYILSDQHAGRFLGCAGDRAALTPNIDRLASEGARFTNAYTPSPVCLPARMSLLTANRPHENQCWTNDDILGSDRPTWLHGLGACGYKPVLVGRMHALGPDQLHGFSERYIGDHSPQWPGVGRRSLGQFDKTASPSPESVVKSGYGATSYDQMDQDVVDAALDLLDKHINTPEAAPFCMAVGFMLPHPPFVSRQEDYEAVRELVAAPDNETPSNHPWLRTWRSAKKIEKLSEEEIHRARIAYYAMVRRLDINVGQLIGALENAGILDGTLVVYLSDHGEHLGEHGLFWKHTFLEPSVNVPLVLRYPEDIPAGLEITAPIEIGGVGPTILDLVAAKPLPNASMPSLVPHLSGRTVEAPVFVEYCTDDLATWSEGFAVQQRSVILGKYKLNYYHGDPVQLFDLEMDPGETADLCDAPDHQEIKQQLLELVLQDWDPDAIQEIISKRRADKVLLKEWAEQTQPKEPLRWPLTADQNRLEGPASVNS